MASHFEDFCELQTFKPHRPSSFFEVLYLYRHGYLLIALVAFSAARAQFSLIAAWFQRAMFFWGLVLATEVAFVVIVVMRIVAALFVVVVAIAAS